jgi:hypothetical protein
VNEGAFHFLIDFAEREPLQFISTIVVVPMLLLVLVVASVRRIHPVVVWLVLCGAFFGLSQVFPENRDQRISIVMFDGVLCGVLIWWWFRRVAPQLRNRLLRNRSAADRRVAMPVTGDCIRVSGLPEGANPMHFIMIVREFTAVGLAEAKAYFDHLKAGEPLVLVPSKSGQASAFATKLLQFKAVQVAEVTAA